MVANDNVTDANGGDSARRRLRLLTWAIFGGLFGLVAALAITILLRGERLPPLTQADW